MTLAIFDLDNTLIAGDSDHAWGEFLCTKGVVDASKHKEVNDQFYQDYLDGALDIVAYQEFALAPLVGRPMAELQAWHRLFMENCIDAMLLPKAFALIDHHRQNGDELLIITATNRFVTAPIAERLGIPELIATEPEIRNDGYTGHITGVPSYQGGKVTRLQEWLKTHPHDLATAHFYSDSHNDIPLLELVGNPVVVDGDARLLEHARQKGWKTISLRD